MMRTDGKKKKLNIVLSLILAISTVLQCGMLKSPSVEMDTVGKAIYMHADAETVADAFADDKDLAKSTYGDRYLLLFGTVFSRKSNNREFELGGSSGIGRSITCSAFDKTVSGQISSILPNDRVKVYGKVTTALIGGEVTVTVDKVEKTTETYTSDNNYSMINGTTWEKSKFKARKLDGDKASFYIPASWEAVEHDIALEGLGNLPGYQYRLNEIGQKSVYAESLFICYFDKKSLVDINDRNENDLIEKAILKDILKKDSLKTYPLKTVSTDYGPKYKYYRDNYKSKTEDKYQVEAAFYEKGNGIFVFLYVYKDAGNIDDILMTLRLFEAY